MERENPYRIDKVEFHDNQWGQEMIVHSPKWERLDIFGIGNIVGLMDEAPNAFLASRDTPEVTTTELIDSLYDSHSKGVFHIWGYRINGNEASYIIGLAKERDSDTIAIGPMYVTEELRGNGIGAMQVNDFIEYYTGPSQMYRKVRTKTWGQNESSRRLFESFGFEQVQTIENDRVNGDSTIIYELDVANFKPFA